MVQPSTTERPSRDEMLMRIAAVVSLRGTCERASVGAVISRDGRVISTGYVGSPSGQPHCISVGCEIGPDGGCTRTVHAEANSIAFSARYGAGVDGSELHTTLAPCVSCAKLIINSGIVRVVYEQEYRDASGLALLEAAGVDVVRLPSPDDYGTNLETNFSSYPKPLSVVVPAKIFKEVEF